MTSAWTAPKTWATNDLVTASDLNTHLRDNLDWLKTPPAGTANLGALITTTATSWADATGLSITFTTTGGRVLLGAAMSVGNTGTAITYLTFSVDGTDQGNAGYGLSAVYPSLAGGYYYSGTIVFLTDALSAGSHTFKVRYKVSSATGSINAGAHFFAREI